MYKEANIIKVIKIRLSRWAEHVARSDDCRVLKCLLENKPNERRARVGRNLDS